MSISTIQKIIFGIIVGSFFVNAILWVNGYGANKKEKNIQSEIINIEEKIKAIKSTLPPLTEQAQKVVDVFSTGTIIPEKEAKEWYKEFFNGLRIGDDIKMEYTLKGRKIPYGMETPWNVRQFGRIIYPTIVPSIVHIKYTGNLSQLAALLYDINWKNPYMIVRLAKLHPNKKNGLYDGELDLVMPQLYYEKDLETVTTFLKKTTPEQKENNEL